MHVEGQCGDEDGGSVCDIGLELLGSISVHKYGGQPQKKSPRHLSGPTHVCIHRFPYYRNQLIYNYTNIFIYHNCSLLEG